MTYEEWFLKVGWVLINTNQIFKCYGMLVNGRSTTPNILTSWKWYECRIRLFPIKVKIFK